MLGALAIPAYLNYLTRSQITDGIALIGGLKTEVAEAVNFGIAPTNRAALNLGPATDTQGEYVASVDVDNGALVILFGNAAAGDIAGGFLEIRPATDVDGNVSWFCGRAPIPAGLTEISVGNTANTTVANEFLPQNCRG